MHYTLLYLVIEFKQANFELVLDLYSALLHLDGTSKGSKCVFHIIKTKHLCIIYIYIEASIYIKSNGVQTAMDTLRTIIVSLR